MVEQATSTQEAQPPTTEERYPVTHVGGAYFEVNGKRIEGKNKAHEYREELIAVEDRLNAPDLSDKLPKGFSARQTTLKWRDSLREVPMNETHMPDGTLNPMYDREWVYVWAAYSDKTDVPGKQADGYHLVSYQDLEELVEKGKAPDHYLNLVREEGRYVVFGDDVLMRMPRVWHRQRKAARQKAALERIKRTDQENRKSFENAGMRPPPANTPNEVTIKL